MLHKVPPPIEHKLLGTLLFLNVGSQIKLSQILAIQNSNHTQEYKYLFGKPFLFERKKTIGQIPNNFTITKSITIIFMYASRLKKKKFLLFFFALSHTNYLSQRQQSFFFSFFTMQHPPSFSLCGTYPFLFLMRHTPKKKSHIIHT